MSCVITFYHVYLQSSEYLKRNSKNFHISSYSNSINSKSVSRYTFQFTKMYCMKITINYHDNFYILSELDFTVKTFFFYLSKRSCPGQKKHFMVYHMLKGGEIKSETQ